MKDNRHLDNLHEVNDDILYIYCDGSRKLEGKECVKVGGGFLLVFNDEVLLEKTVTSTQADHCSAWNVGGELITALDGLRSAIKMYPEKRCIRIVHDYTGIADWTCGRWKISAKTFSSVSELRFLYKKLLEIGYDVDFIKIKSHTSTKNKATSYNAMADKLAAMAIK